MPTFIKTGYWDKLSKAPKGYLNLDLITGGGGVTSVTKTEVDTLISSNSLVPGGFYEISGVDVPLYGGTTILIQAATSNTLALAGHGIFYNPNYEDNGIWDGLTTYVIGQSVAWGGRVWNNLNGDDGNAVDKYTLSDPAWEVIPFTNPNYYNVVVDVIHYDYENDKIIRRKDKWNNDVDGNVSVLYYFNTLQGFGNPIKDFQWGNGPIDSSSSDGVYGNYVKDSYLECINFIGNDISYNTLNQQSYIHNNITDVNSSIYSNVLTNDARIIDNTLTNCAIGNNNLIKGCYIEGNTITASNISSNNLNINSTIFFNIVNNDSNIFNNTLTDSNINGNTLNDNSYINNNILKDSNISNAVMSDNCSIGYNQLNSTYFDLINTTNFSTNKTISSLVSNTVSIAVSLNSATVIFNVGLVKQAFKNSAGTNRLGYYNASDVFTVVNVNA